MTISFVHAKAVQWASEYDGPLFHSLYCDPPYHLTTIVKRFGKDDSAPAKGGVYARASKGFMGQTWDGGDVAFVPETWDTFKRILHPGAFCMAFASARGWHRLAVAIEDAGFIIHPTIFGWLYGSGFPKATRIDTRIPDEFVADGSQITSQEFPKEWSGYRYGLQALKPALEPLLVFQNPYEGRPLDNMLESGAGALNIDGTRIPTDPEYDDMLRPVNRQERESETWRDGSGFKNEENHFTGVPENGRWPANFYLGDPESAEALDRQSGNLVSGEPAGIRKAKNNVYSEYKQGMPVTGFGDEGGASRFFFRVQEKIDDADPVKYCAKADRFERDAGLKGFEKQDLNWSSGDQSPGTFQSAGTNRSSHNPHPTVKPLDLNRYFTTMLLPPKRYNPRRIFIPFAGVGSEAIGAFQANWDEIVAVEMKEDYVKIAEARYKFWADRKQLQLPLMEE